MTKKIIPAHPTLTAADVDLATKACQEGINFDIRFDDDDATSRVSDACLVAADAAYGMGLRAGLRRGLLVMATAYGNKDAERLLQLHRVQNEDAVADAILLEFVRQEGGAGK